MVELAHAPMVQSMRRHDWSPELEIVDAGGNDSALDAAGEAVGDVAGALLGKEHEKDEIEEEAMATYAQESDSSHDDPSIEPFDVGGVEQGCANGKEMGGDKERKLMRGI
ncbi:hypothetical protein GLOTRDRAFT_134268 [Gloeophyllum trabeum ATCC 11539]|uniref:Uncharacterized protein n=1 Tax=Gloeophyllum trabeum (strain ATCC 11539 / FP-39264 / Madison 617) TaxID=670483 RepID=S7R6S2_GLOTA|nr:uncharacterized protein GLOTRDRAFT_134268 [Gloeophyllum trabeum ATCC 11539]EPQ50085.1 hypothetical protein GLOTRDRAFT_134268 [Gloeophyllum trabeum ATCC 11539]